MAGASRDFEHEVQDRAANIAERELDEPMGATEQTMPAMGRAHDAPGEVVALCVVPDCYEHGVQEVIQEVPVRWPSGRVLMGCIVHKSLICERHFEALVRGRNVP